MASKYEPTPRLTNDLSDSSDVPIFGKITICNCLSRPTAEFNIPLSLIATIVDNGSSTISFNDSDIFQQSANLEINNDAANGISKNSCKTVLNSSELN
ncbi:hypothetical protein WICMUC_000664 [Wickerhamomyces mucosus]|uniref:Uncharacterized protein n=1 Tax=Wickerhamomyces mucosus TaxID=1378264 RepID=A0A9P8TIC9_9ASCO|nr:hypothetical protein WICMUC_000664 [Wickerhamomyces mucosus]